jgi:hypothetical protein
MSGDTAADDIHTVRDPETGEELNHYAWTSWMWCEVEKTAAGDYDAVQASGECSACGAEI